MKKSRYNRLLSYSLSFAIAIILAWLGCSQTEESNYTGIATNKEVSSAAVDFNLINQLNESNQRTIEIASYIFNKSQDVQTLQLILKIKNDHQKIDSEIKKITQKNLILLPSLDYYLNFKSDFLKLKKSKTNLLAVLETELNQQILVLQQINQTSQNSDFKIFTKQSIQTIKTNILLLKNNF